MGCGCALGRTLIFTCEGVEYRGHLFVHQVIVVVVSWSVAVFLCPCAADNRVAGNRLKAESFV